MRFKYKAKNEEGAMYEGEIDAVDKFALFADLKKRGDAVIFAREIKRRSFSWADLLKRFAFYSISIKDKIIFAKNLGAMIKAGLPMSRALLVMEKQTRNPGLKKIISNVGEEIGKGRALHEALSEYPRVFPNIFVSVVRAGEESGGLAKSLGMVANQLDRNYYIRRKVRGAMMYPAIIISLIVAIAVMMVVFVVPKLTATFSEMNIVLPWSTRLLINASAVAKNHYLSVIIALILLIVGFRMAIKTKPVKRILDICILSFPIIGSMIREMNSARTARTLASLLSSGVDVVSSIDITSDTLQNSLYKDVLSNAKKNIEKGEPMSEAFSKNERVYPAFFAEMVSAGEETGNIAGMLEDVGNFYETEIDQKTKDFASIIEPLIMVFMGVAVGFFAYAMLTPMYSLMGSIQ